MQVSGNTMMEPELTNCNTLSFDKRLNADEILVLFLEHSTGRRGRLFVTKNTESRLSCLKKGSDHKRWLK